MDCLEVQTKNSNSVNKQISYMKASMKSALAVPDGQWFDLAFNLKFNEREVAEDSTFEVIYITGPEGGVDIEVDNIRLELPPESGYPDGAKPEDICTQLFPGQAVLGAVHPFPLTTTHVDKNRNNYAPLVVRKEGSSTYYSVIGRSYNWQSLTFPINPECSMPGSSYLFRSKLRLHSNIIIGGAKVEMRTWDQDGKENSRITIVTCPTLGGNLGWVECYGGFTFEEKHSNASRIEWRLITGADKLSDIDYKDISIAISQGSVDKIVVDKSVEGCWGVGSEILITSHTLKYDDDQVVTIESITSDPGDDIVVLGLSNAILPPTTETQDPNFAVEVALLSRNVAIQGAQDTTINSGKNGGYMSIYYTPNVDQLVQGVQFQYMGQEGVVDRFPIHFKMCGDVNGAMVSKNSIIDSYQRCIVLQNTSYAEMTENVAYNTAGHCYTVQDGGETENLFRNNLGAKSTRILSPISGQSDKSPATYYAGNPNNHWIGNVAAGSYDSGFKIYPYYKVNEESLPFHKGLNPRKAGIGSFVNNVVHSSTRGIYLLYLENDAFADDPPALVNTKVFRNKVDGIKFHASRYMGIEGGLLADNRYGFVADYCDSLHVHGTTIVGQSDTFEEMLTFQGLSKFCPSSFGLRGLFIAPHRYRGNPYSGIDLSNLHFEGFDKTEDCAGSVAIEFIKKSRYSHWDLTSSLKNVSIIDSRNFGINGCSVVSKDINDIVITDIDGSLHPDHTFIPTGPSSIVSIEPHMTTFANGPCTDLSEQCLTFCENTCLRTVNFDVERDAAENLTLHVHNIGDNKTIDVYGNIDVNSNMYWNRYYTTYRRFSASLPAGQYSAEFHQEGIPAVFPIFARELWEPEPQCLGHVAIEDVSLSFSVPNCDNFIKNGDMEDGHKYWHHVKGDIQFLPGKGIAGSNAIGSINRKSYNDAIGQYINIPCVKNNVGKYLEFKAWIKLVDSNGKVMSCDPNNLSDKYKSCPVVYLKSERHKDSSKMTYKASYQSGKAKFIQPLESGDFNLLHGVFRISETLGNAESIFLYITRFNKNYEIILDNVSLTLFDTSCDDLVSNGDLKLGNSLYWETNGLPSIEIVPGYDGNGDSAIKVSKRTRSWNGPSQNIKVGCFEEGKRYLVKAKLKLEKDDKVFECNPFDYDSTTRCPEIMLKATKQGVSSEYKTIANVAAPTSELYWDNLAGVFYATEKIIHAEALQVWFQNQDVPIDITVDNFEIIPFPQDCKNALLNPSFEDGSVDFWQTNSRTQSKIAVYTPGADGSSFAIRSYNRKKNAYGMEQLMDDKCLTTGETMVISANLRLQYTNGTGAMCDYSQFSLNGKNCPPVRIYGSHCSGESITILLWNENLYPWKSNDYNNFQADFSVDENFASCTHVSFGIRDINKDWEVIADNIRVSPKSLFSPTLVPTLSPLEHVPTTLTSIPTASPVTGSPTTQAPTGPSMLRK